MENKFSIGVIGAGTWGMALARSLSMCGHSVVVWSALPEEIDYLNQNRRQVNLPDMVIPDEVVFTKDIFVACDKKDIILFAVPSPYVRSTAKLISLSQKRCSRLLPALIYEYSPIMMSEELSSAVL